jgi:hypothetical protein
MKNESLEPAAPTIYRQGVLALLFPEGFSLSEIVNS